MFLAVMFVVGRIFPPTQTLTTPATTAVVPNPAAPTTSRTGIGENTTVREAKGFWPCGSTPEAYDELMKWATHGDNPELKRAMGATRSIALSGGMQVKILDIGFGKRRVRVLTNDAGQTYLKDEQGVFPADVRIGRECWITAEALH